MPWLWKAARADFRDRVAGRINDFIFANLFVWETIGIGAVLALLSGMEEQRLRDLPDIPAD